MGSIRRCDLPIQALHRHYQEQGDYVDCYTTVVRGAISHSDFVEAFYTTLLFKLERLILFVFLGKSSTDDEAHLLAASKIDKFAAWTVEWRVENQLLMRDFRSSTRSWLMVVQDGSGDVVTHLYFGSVVVRKKDTRTGVRKMGFLFKVLLPFHKLYSRTLLAAAKFRIRNAASR